MKILLATDGSAFSDAAIDEIARRPWPEGSELKILFAAEPFMPPVTETWVVPSDYYEEIERAADEQAREVVNKAADRLRSATGERLPITADITYGNARQAILNAAEAWGADLIVVGSHGRTGITRFLLGSVSQSIASHAKCSVEIVRAQNKAEANTD